MKIKLLIFAIVIAFIAGCEKEREREREYFTIDGYKVVRIDGCQYFQNITYCQYDVLTHKGNCDNPIHKGNNK